MHSHRQFSANPLTNYARLNKKKPDAYGICATSMSDEPE